MPDTNPPHQGTLIRSLAFVPNEALRQIEDLFLALQELMCRIATEEDIPITDVTNVLTLEYQCLLQRFKECQREQNTDEA